MPVEQNHKARKRAADADLVLELEAHGRSAFNPIRVHIRAEVGLYTYRLETVVGGVNENAQGLGKGRLHHVHSGAVSRNTDLARVRNYRHHRWWCLRNHLLDNRFVATCEQTEPFGPDCGHQQCDDQHRAGSDHDHSYRDGESARTDARPVDFCKIWRYRRGLIVFA